MEILLLKFARPLATPSELVRLHGPLFYRWLPDGEKNAITLSTNDDNANLKVWFERYGFVDGGFVRFSYDRREVTPDIIHTQNDRNLFLGSATENSVILPTIACPHGFKSRKRLLETANQPSDGRFGQTVSDTVVLCQP